MATIREIINWMINLDANFNTFEITFLILIFFNLGCLYQAHNKRKCNRRKNSKQNR